MTRTKTNCPDKSVLHYSSSVQYVKDVLDSTYTLGPWLGGYELEGHTLLARRYSNLKDEREKKLIAQAIVKLLDDPDYSCDAIPVASELGLEEAKDWFLNLSKKSLEEIRNVKTNGYSNALYCFLNFILNQYDKVFLSFIKKILNESQDRLEVMRALSILSEVEPDLALEAIPKHIPLLMQVDNEESKKTAFQQITIGVFKRYGDRFCTELANKFKTNLSNEFRLIFYKSLEQISRFKPYLEELKKILEINN